MTDVFDYFHFDLVQNLLLPWLFVTLDWDWLIKLVEVLYDLQHLDELPSVGFVRHQESDMANIVLLVEDAVLILSQLVHQPFIVVWPGKFVSNTTEKGDRHARESLEVDHRRSFTVIQLEILRKPKVILSEVVADDELSIVVDASV